MDVGYRFRAWRVDGRSESITKKKYLSVSSALVPLTPSLETVEGPMMIASIYVDIYLTLSLMLGKTFCFVILEGQCVFFYYFVLVLDRNKINKDKQYRLLELIYFVFRFTGISQILLISNQHRREIRMILIARCRSQLDIGNHISKIEVAYSVLKAIKCFHSFVSSGE